jgi:hypothetical protein
VRWNFGVSLCIFHAVASPENCGYHLLDLKKGIISLIYFLLSPFSFFFVIFHIFIEPTIFSAKSVT